MAAVVLLVTRLELVSEAGAVAEAEEVESEICSVSAPPGVAEVAAGLASAADRPAAASEPDMPAVSLLSAAAAAEDRHPPALQWLPNGIGRRMLLGAACERVPAVCDFGTTSGMPLTKCTRSPVQLG